LYYKSDHWSVYPNCEISAEERGKGVTRVYIGIETSVDECLGIVEDAVDPGFVSLI
jgi:hypothetical protein